MKKKVLAVLMSVVMLGTLTACGGQKSEETGQQKATEAEEDSKEKKTEAEKTEAEKTEAEKTEAEESKAEGTEAEKDTKNETDGVSETEAANTDKESEAAKSDVKAEDPAGKDSGDSAQIKTGGILKIGTPAEIVNLGYPGKPGSSNELIVMQPAVEPLCRYTKEGELDPWLCESFEADADALTLTVKLKEGIKFHDGTDFNAEAVKWNWEAFTAQGRTEIGAIKSIECPDDNTVVAHLALWDNTIPDNALWLAGFMYSPAYAKENGEDKANVNPVGTGPFKFKEWKKDVSISFEANKDYWIEGQPYLDGIEFEFIADANTLTTAYQAGELDALGMIFGDSVSIMKATGEESKAEDGLTGGATISIVAFGCTDEKSPCKDLKVRQAFCHAVDWETLCQASGNGSMYYVNQWAVPGTWSYNDDVAGYPYDTEKAKELLKEAGYKDGVKINCYTVEPNTTQATMLQQYLSEAGIELDIQIIDQSRSDEMSGINGNWDGIILSAGRADVEIASIYGRSFTDEGVRYVGGFLHPEDLAEVISNAKAAKTQEDRAKYCKEMAKMIIDEYWMIAPIGIGSGVQYEKDYVHDTGILRKHMIAWTPEACWLDK